MTHERNTIETLEDGTKRLTDAAGAIYRAMPDSEFGLAAFYDRGERWTPTGEVSVELEPDAAAIVGKYEAK